MKSFEITKSKQGKHIVVEAYYKKKKVIRFGINHGSRKNAGHGWVYEQMNLNRNEGLDFANCDMDVDELVQLLKDRDVIEDD